MRGARPSNDDRRHHPYGRRALDRVARVIVAALAQPRAEIWIPDG